MKDAHFEQLIRTSLSAEEAAYYDKLGEPGIIEKMTLIYRGKTRWISILQTIAMSVIFGFGVYAAIRFYKGVEVVAMIKWGFAAIFALVASSMVKLYLIQLMIEQSLKREIKRLELQMAHLISHQSSE